MRMNPIEFVLNLVGAKVSVKIEPKKAAAAKKKTSSTKKKSKKKGKSDD